MCYITKVALHFMIGPPGNDGIGLPGRQGDRGEPGRPGNNRAKQDIWILNSVSFFITFLMCINFTYGRSSRYERSARSAGSTWILRTL